MIKKYENIIKIVLIIFSIMGLLGSFYFLLIGISCINSTGMNVIGTIFIFPAFIALFIFLFDLLAILGKLKNALIYSYISTAIKILVILKVMPSLVNSIIIDAASESSSLFTEIMIFIMLIIIAIQSITIVIILRNTKVSKRKTNKKRTN